MNNANKLLSPCELIRQINDMFQGDSDFHIKVRKKLAELEDMTKDMSKEICKHRDDYHTIWKSNPTFKEDLDRRTSKNYKYFK